MKGVLRRVGHDLFVVYTTTMTFEPIQHTLWWKVLRSQGAVHDLADGCEVTFNSDPMGDSTWSAWSKLFGATVILWTEHESGRIDKEPVTPPKTRLETRWRDGRWEKCDKRKGWVQA